MKHDEVRLNPASATFSSSPTNNNDLPDSGHHLKRGTNRRTFLGQVGVAAGVAAGALAAPSVASASPSAGITGAGLLAATSPANIRIIKATALRAAESASDGLVAAAKNINNGDLALYADHGGTYTKGLAHDQYGRVTAASYQSFINAINSGKFSAYEAIIVGGTKTLNGPQGALAFDLEALDNAQFSQPQVPAAPPIAGDQSAMEMVEHYWGSLLRDVAFTDYGTSPVAAAAAAELSSQPTYVGPRNGSGQVTTDLLFRGGFPGETLGPYLSQFFVQPTFFGNQPLDQMLQTYLPGTDFGTDFGEWLDIQNGVSTGRTIPIDSQPRFGRNGRDLSAYTRVDVLYQAYFTAFLILAGGGAPRNPGNPYVASHVENGFGTLGGPDFAGSFGEVATKALNAVWYQKWNVHLRPRPEAFGGNVHLAKTGQGQFSNVVPSNVVLNSVALAQSFAKYGTYLLSLAFPEGSPTHPAYPTGHGTVGGACITLLKFFFDGSHVLSNPVVPTPDGLSLAPYTGSDAGRLTVNGELNKLGHNVSFGHGIHAGIHWRSDTDTSLLLGEAVALSFLKNKAKTYNEPFTVHLTKFDGTTATISNAGNP